MTANQAKMRRLVEQAYAARGAGDVDGLMAAFHDDAIFALSGDKKALALTGTVRGHPNVREAMAGFISAYEFIKRDIVSFIADGDRAAVHCRLTIRFIPKDITFATELVDMFKFQDGKIIELIEFADTALVKQVSQ